jgi:hypothetical protein
MPSTALQCNPIVGFWHEARLWRLTVGMPGIGRTTDQLCLGDTIRLHQARRQRGINLALPIDRATIQPEQARGSHANQHEKNDVEEGRTFSSA